MALLGKGLSFVPLKHQTASESGIRRVVILLFKQWVLGMLQVSVGPERLPDEGVHSSLKNSLVLGHGSHVLVL